MPTPKLVIDTLQSLADLGLIGAPKVSEVVVGLYIQSLAGVTDAEFTAAVGEHMRSSKFYPKPAEIYAIVEKARASRSNHTDSVIEFWRRVDRQNPTFALSETDREAYLVERAKREAYWKEQGEHGWEVSEVQLSD